MAFVLNDRVKQTSTSTGTGTINLTGTETGFETFVTGIGDGNSCFYAIANDGTSEFEVGIGTVTDAATDTLTGPAKTPESIVWVSEIVELCVVI